MKLFGTDGIRGHVGDFLTADLALQVGFCTGLVLRETGSKLHPNATTVFIGQDSRVSSDMLSAALAAGLTAAGLDVSLIGLCPTPAVAYLTAQMPEAIAGIMVSASHNPPCDNGIKVFGADGCKISAQLQDQIEALIAAGQNTQASHAHLQNADRHDWGSFGSRSQLINAYQDSLVSSIRTDLANLKIVLDLAWGAATSVAPSVFRRCGAEVISLHQQADGKRINVNCGSTHLDALQQSVRENNADIGFAFDGDADRALAVDANGTVVDGDYILYLWGQELLEGARLPDATIVTTVMANLGFERAWQKLGGNLVRTPVGDRHVHAEMVKSGSMLGGEQSGHVLCRHYGVSGDGLLTALHLAAIVKQKAPLTELLQQSFSTYPQLLHNVRVVDKERRTNWQTCDPIMQAIDHATNNLGDRGRVLVRASGTEPVVRVMVEAECMDLAQHWTNHLGNLIKLQLA
ncbi:phosphoglucosamine mutase [Thalassoporum mexicanum PCC 7367]|uniref:phosphoglucosamine mutase n=1 Tax=Thalassoporum mexicanum TaxID=3457544 RepID=UPI00029F8172|nr:phosphoglucosamine mutase [Pseudanabaena sp. PCC 7367]AFY69369.1 phosphoglucosamine mutase [Pseudanabaena sp. PCC 7367]